MKLVATLFTALVGLTAFAAANPYAEALYDQFESNIARRDLLRQELDARDLYERDLYERAIVSSHVYARDFDSHLLSPRDLEQRELHVRSTVVWTDPSMLNQKGSGQKAQAGKVLKAQYEHFIRDWADRKFGSSAYVRIQDAPHDSGSRADGRGGDARDHFTVEVVGGSASSSKAGKGVWYHVYPDGGEKQL